MATKKERIVTRKKPSAEGEAMDVAFKKAVKRAERRAFAVRNTIMVEKDGWLVMVNREGKVIKRIKRIELIQVPAT